jgi:hypothetical protein
MTYRVVRWSALMLYVVLVPLGIMLRLTTDPLRLRRPPATNWQPVRERPDSLDRARGLV